MLDESFLIVRGYNNEFCQAKQHRPQRGNRNGTNRRFPLSIRHFRKSSSQVCHRDKSFVMAKEPNGETAIRVVSGTIVYFILVPFGPFIATYGTGKTAYKGKKKSHQGI